MTDYRFSPIETPAAFNEALQYVAERVGDLSLQLCGEQLPVPIVKLFAHSDAEYDYLEQLVRRHGEKASVSSHNSFYVDVASGLTVAGVPLTLLGVRRPTEDRPQVGCGDYEVADFPAYTAALLQRQPNYARPVHNAHGLGMVELWHPSFDVLGYVIPVRD